MASKHIIEEPLSPESREQSPESRERSPESRGHSPESREHSPESREQHSPESREQHSPESTVPSPNLTSKDPSLPKFLPTTSKHGMLQVEEETEEPLKKRCFRFLYDREKKTCCGRTKQSWLHLIAYSILYFIFLCTYTLIFLYFSLLIVKATVDYQSIDKVEMLTYSDIGIGIDKAELLTYSENGIGISATPTSETNQPLIWYRKDNVADYQKYVRALDNLLVKKRRKRDLDKLGPCGKPPYGYGDKPCIILRINKQLHWVGKALETNSSQAKIAPLEVQNWLKRGKKLWFYCEGYHSYDKEHIGRLRYYPDPPGIESSVFPLQMGDASPLVAVQISDFTLGISLAVQCKLWYTNGPSSVEFMLYVAPNDSTVSNRTNV